MDLSQFFLPSGSPNMTDVMVTLSAVIGGIIAWRQKAKDFQLSERDKHIVWLQDQLEKTRNELDRERDRHNDSFNSPKSE